jgi:pimeloyl-ACP methyl ester carboxylesterase
MRSITGGMASPSGTPGFVRAFSAPSPMVSRLCLNLSRRDIGDTPRFLVGHSMGGLIAAAHLVTHHQADYDGAIFPGRRSRRLKSRRELMIWVSRSAFAVRCRGWACWC